MRVTKRHLDCYTTPGRPCRFGRFNKNSPVLAAKLQALFDWEHNISRVADGKVPVLIHRLSPPTCTASWRNAYPEVRKDIHVRYPWHPWPETRPVLC